MVIFGDGMSFDIVLATDANGGIGNKGGLPWPHDPEDMKRFAQITKGGVVIMGRKTYESLPPSRRPLPGRVNIVLSSTQIKEAIVCKTLDEALQLAWSEHKDKKVFVIGGVRVFEEGIEHPALHMVHWTLFHHLFPCDTYFTKVFCKFWVTSSITPGVLSDFVMLRKIQGCTVNDSKT